MAWSCSQGCRCGHRSAAAACRTGAGLKHKPRGCSHRVCHEDLTLEGFVLFFIFAAESSCTGREKNLWGWGQPAELGGKCRGNSVELIRLVPQGHKPRACLERVYLVFSGYLQKCRQLMILRVINLFWFVFFSFSNKTEVSQSCFRAVSYIPSQVWVTRGKKDVGKNTRLNPV